MRLQLFKKIDDFSGKLEKYPQIPSLKPKARLHIAQRIMLGQCSKMRKIIWHSMILP